MIKPYFQDEYVTIYNADCRQLLSDLPKVDLVMTDPPYNVGKDYDTHNDSMLLEEYMAWATECVKLCLPLANNQFWVAPRYKLQLWLSLLPKSHLITIRRGACGPFREGWSDQFEIALAIGKPSKCVSDLWDGIRLKGEGYFFREETFGHPGYTPSPIFAKAVALLSTNSILDPFLGTGTSIVVAKKMGRKAIGIEISESYCEIAAKRCMQTVMQFEQPKEIVEQGNLMK